MITIYHNQRCSKSRQAMAMLEQISAQKNIPLKVVYYLETPLGKEQLEALRSELGIDLRAMVRDTEAEYAELQLTQADDQKLLQALVSHPKLLQRPVVSYQGRAVIARPPERLLDLLPTD